MMKMTLEEQIKFIQELVKKRTLALIRASKADEQEMAEVDALNQVAYTLLYLQDIQTIINNHVK